MNFGKYSFLCLSARAFLLPRARVQSIHHTCCHTWRSNAEWRENWRPTDMKEWEEKKKKGRQLFFVSHYLYARGQRPIPCDGFATALENFLWSIFFFIHNLCSLGGNVSRINTAFRVTALFSTNYLSLSLQRASEVSAREKHFSPLHNPILCACGQQIPPPPFFTFMSALDEFYKKEKIEGLWTGYNSLKWNTFSDFFLKNFAFAKLSVW